MWDAGLILAAALVAQPQAATLESCEFVDERWVCRYRLPDIQLLSEPPDAPVTLPVPLPSAPTTSTDPGVLSESESELVARCAEARWISLCFPSQRVEARRLRDEARAYEAARQRVGELISQGQCQAATAHALSGGYLALARESQGFCRTQ
ncbi:hypothetical protein [Brevundimonas sp.]|uniref:hypothetical protein n=1 Tax=Brevundimonas sp. TaxID=1871086 RepID=UPI0025CFBB8F|nr:hypothetical protein [Brevundimonas sp.]